MAAARDVARLDKDRPLAVPLRVGCVERVARRRGRYACAAAGALAAGKGPRVGPRLTAREAAHVVVRLARRVGVAKGTVEREVEALDESDVKEHDVRVCKLEEEGLDDERVLVLRVGAVVLEIVEPCG